MQPPPQGHTGRQQKGQDYNLGLCDSKDLSPSSPGLCVLPGVLCAQACQSMLGACWQVPVSGSGRRLQGRLLASVPVVSPLEPGMKVADPPRLLGREEGSCDGVPQSARVGLQEDRGTSHQLQDPGGQRGGREGALGGQQRAGGGGEAELPLEGLVGGVEGFLQRRLVEEEGDEVQDGVDSLRKGEKGQVNRQPP